MIQFLDTSDDVIACSIERPDGADPALLGRIEASIAKNARTHLFIGVHRLRDVDWKAVAGQLPRGLKLLSKHDRFGRVALVSDESIARE